MSILYGIHRGDGKEAGFRSVDCFFCRARKASARDETNRCDAVVMSCWGLFFLLCQVLPVLVYNMTTGSDRIDISDLGYTPATDVVVNCVK